MPSEQHETSTQIEKLIHSGLELMKRNETAAAISLLQQAAELGDRYAMFFLGHACGGTLKSLYWFQKAGELGDVAAMLEYLKLFEKYPDNKNEAVAEIFFIRAIDRHEFDLAPSFAKYIIRNRKFELFAQFSEFIFLCSRSDRQTVCRLLIETKDVHLIELAIKWLSPELVDKIGKFHALIGDAYNGLGLYKDALQWHQLGAESGDSHSMLYLQLYQPRNSL